MDTADLSSPKNVTKKVKQELPEEGNLKKTIKFNQSYFIIISKIIVKCINLKKHCGATFHTITVIVVLQFIRVILVVIQL